MSPSSLAPEQVQLQSTRPWAAVPETRQQASVSFGRRSAGYERAKRVFDVIASGCAVVCLTPVFALLAVAIKLESRGPVLFGHWRLGQGGRPFRCLKFRSMRSGAHERLLSDPQLRHWYLENDYKIPLDRDPRVTRVGRFLRKSSLDELPQLLNVLAGSMSLVGPRPIVRDEMKWYAGREDQLLSVRPGITGEWQIQGRSRIGYPERANVEIAAIERRSLLGDLWILVKSVPAVITARGSL